jgi:hypothetical protein
MAVAIIDTSPSPFPVFLVFFSFPFFLFFYFPSGRSSLTGCRAAALKCQDGVTAPGNAESPALEAVLHLGSAAVGGAGGVFFGSCHHRSRMQQVIVFGTHLGRSLRRSARPLLLLPPTPSTSSPTSPPTGPPALVIVSLATSARPPSRTPSLPRSLAPSLPRSFRLAAASRNTFPPAALFSVIALGSATCSSRPRAVSLPLRRPPPSLFSSHFIGSSLRERT